MLGRPKFRGRTPLVLHCSGREHPGSDDRVPDLAVLYLSIRLAGAEITGAGLEWTVSMISLRSMPCG